MALIKVSEITELAKRVKFKKLVVKAKRNVCQNSFENRGVINWGDFAFLHDSTLSIGCKYGFVENSSQFLWSKVVHGFHDTEKAV